MTETPVTVIASYGLGGSSSSSALFMAELDETMNLDEEGKAKSQFAPGEPAWFLLHHAANVRVIRLRDTAEGDIQLIGPVSRTREQQITFQPPGHEVELSYQPSGTPSAVWYGRSSGLVLSGRKLKADAAPCLGDISYPIAATQFLYRPPPGMTIEADEDYPIDVVIEWEEIV